MNRPGTVFYIKVLKHLNQEKKQPDYKKLSPKRKKGVQHNLTIIKKLCKKLNPKLLKRILRIMSYAIKTLKT